MKKYRVTFWCLENSLYETEIEFEPGDVVSKNDINFFHLEDVIDVYHFNCANGFYYDKAFGKINLVNLSNVQRIELEEINE